jgi:uncharacterized lipoprotein YddW (UPF0748 family)
MKLMRKSLLLSLLAVAACALMACSSTPTPDTPSPIPPSAWEISKLTPPEPVREFRAAWVATVANIDWPSKPGLSSDEMRAEIVQNVQTAKRIGLNALILQVRPAADAIYPSALEPWTEWLTGQQGTAPATLANGNTFDPLQTWIDQAHANGIELHAWFNPYRARHVAAKSNNVPAHVSTTMPTAVKRYGGFDWLDPGDAQAAEHSLRVIEDVVRRYAVDGIHIDDYFYPYPVNSTAALGTGTAAIRQEFPDEATYTAHQREGGKLSRADWRRDNVNRFVKAMDARVRALKPWVRVGVSPFGLGKPALRPTGIRGFSQYDELYADVELWLQRGWMDYLAPQLYWPIAQPAQAFEPLLDYWTAQNTAQRQVFAGLYTSRINNTTATWQPAEIEAQINIVRSKAVANKQLSGHIHFSMIALSQNRAGIADAMTSAYANGLALAPVHPRAERVGTGDFAWNPEQFLSKGVLDLAAANGEGGWLVQTRTGDLWQTQFIKSPQTQNWQAPAQAQAVALSRVDAFGQLQRLGVWQRTAPSP